jgi:hypothetical protein
MSSLFNTASKPHCDFLETEFFLKVELYYATPPQHNFLRAANSPEVMKAEVNKPTTKFRCVQTRLFQFNQCLHSSSTFLPIEFDREYTSMCMMTMHSSIINFSFSAPTASRQLKPLHVSESDDEDGDRTYMENGIVVERKFQDLAADQQRMLEGEASTSVKKPRQPQNISEYFFYNQFGSLEVTESSFIETYKAYTNVLKYAH